MKKIIYLVLVAAGAGVLSSADYKSAGPPGCFAGEPPNNTNCTSCHADFAVNSGNATVLFDVGGADTGYALGATYDITISIKNAGMSAAGFQFIALRDDDVTTSPGSITLNDATRTQRVDPSNPHVQGCGLFDKVYVEHTFQGINLSLPNENLWTFKWKAPDNYVGDISFYMATVEADFSGDEFGDYVYTRKVLSKGKPSSIQGVSAVADISIFPNPAVSKLYIKSTGSNLKQVLLMNMQGAKLKQLDDFTTVNATTLTLDVESIKPGVYFLMIQGEGVNATRKVVIE